MAEAIASITRQLRAKSGTDKRQEAPESSSSFFIMCTGQVESGEFDGSDNLYCRYALTYGSDWTVMHGPDAGLSQIARKLGGEDRRVVWNFPIDITFKTTNAFGWPRIAISVYGIDSLGRDVVRGYGSVLIPTTSGQHERLVVLYRPVASSRLRQFLGWIAGTLPEFFDSKFVNQGEGREVTRVETTGMVKVKLNIMTKGMGRFGYSCREPDSQRSANALATSAFEGSSSLLLDKSTGGNTLLAPRTSVPASLP